MSSCTDEERCISGFIDLEDLESLGCDNSANLTTINSLKEFELITSQEQFDQLVETPCNVTIDWEKYDLLIGMIGLPNGYVGMTKQLVQDCSRDQYDILIAIELNETTVAPIISWNVLLPKASDFFVRPVSFD